MTHALKTCLQPREIKRAPLTRTTMLRQPQSAMLKQPQSAMIRQPHSNMLHSLIHDLTASISHALTASFEHAATASCGPSATSVARPLCRWDIKTLSLIAQFIRITSWAHTRYASCPLLLASHHTLLEFPQPSMSNSFCTAFSSTLKNLPR